MRSISILAFLILLSLIFIPISVLFSQTNYWYKLGGNNISQTINSIKIDSDGIIYIAMDNGVLISNDKGETWSQTSLTEKIMSIDINEDNIYAATFDKGVFRSSDSGNTWQNIGLTYLNICTAKVKNNGKLFLAPYYDKGLYFSSNDGLSWDSVLYNIQVSSILFYKDTIYVACSEGIKKSVDDGFTWSQVGLVDKTIIGLEIDSSGVIYAALYDEDIKYSTDNGSTWKTSSLNTSPPYFSPFLVDNFNNVFVGGNSYLYKSTDHGSNWVNLGLEKLVTSFAVDEENNLFAGTYNEGFFISSDEGQTWVQSNNGLSNREILCLTLTSNNYIFFGTYNDGVYISTNDGESWSQTNLRDRNVYALLKDSYNNIYAGTSSEGIYKSTDYGVSWTNFGLQDIGISSLALSSSNTLFAGSDKIYFTTDQGDKWEGIDYGKYSIKAIGVFSDSTLFIGSDSSGVLITSDQGKTWITTGETYWTALTFLFKDEFVFVGISQEGVYRSSNGGANWNFSGLSGISVKNLIMNSLGDIYAATDSGVFYSTDNGEIWTSVNSGLENKNIHMLLLNSDGYIYAGLTYEIYKSVGSTTDIQNDIKKFPNYYSLSQNYPNPFNPATNIQFSIPQQSFVTLKVYDILGKEVATLVNEEKSTGSYNVSFNASNLSSGVYFFSIKARDFSQTRKMVLMK